MFTSGSVHGEAIGCYRGEPLYHASLDSDVYAELLGAHGFEVVAHIVGDAWCGGHTLWLAHFAGGAERPQATPGERSSTLGRDRA